MKKLLLLLLLTTTFNFFGQTISPLSNGCFGNPFNLTTKNTELLNGQSSNDFTITFYLTLSDATLLLNSIANPNSFVGANNQTIFVNVLNVITNVATINSFSLVNSEILINNTSIISDINCTNNGSISINASGGNAPYTYGNVLNFQGGTPINQGVTSNVFSNLIAGTYTTWVMDANQCVSFQTATLIHTEPVNLSVTFLNSNSVAINGGEQPCQYSLDNGVFQVWQSFSNLAIGNHNVNVVDANGCNGSINFTITLCNLTATTQVSGNTFTILASGGSPPYQYSINGTQFQSNPTFTDMLPNVEYLFFVIDSNGCTVDGMASVPTCNFTLSQGFTSDGTPNSPPSAYVISVIENTPSLPPADQYAFYLDGILLNTQPNQMSVSFPTIGFPTGVYTVQVVSSSCSITTNFIIDAYLLTGSAIGTYIDSNNDGITNVGDTINYQYTVNNTSNANAINVNVVSSNPALIISGNPIASFPINAIDNSTFSGVYVLNQNDINQGNVLQNVAIVSTNNSNPNIINGSIISNTTLNLSDGIKLNAFIDTNSNGFQDGTEQNFSLGNFTTQLNSGMIHNITSSSGAYYLYETNPVNLYNFTFAINSAFASQYSVETASYNNISVASGSGITTLNFAITAIPYNDLSVSMFGNAPNPGFTYYNYISYSNNGNTTIPTGTVTFNLNNVVSIINISEAGAVNNANGFTYNFTNLLPYETRTILVTMQVPVIPNVSLGQQLTNSASITIPSNDVNIANNSFDLTQTIVGSFDPNDKTESHGGKILRSSFTANDYLTYKIQFENTGTANAITVKVTDVLDNLLDENSIKMVASSHNYTLDRTGKNLEWKFNAINLPPSVANTQIGHGYLVFQIRPKPGFAVGDIIPNFASIYFDFNPAIVTETCNTEFVAALSNESFAFNNLRIYPNPATNILNIDNQEIIENVEVSNLLGQTILNQKVDNLESKIDLSGLTNGVYFVKIAVGESEKVLKVIKE